MQQSKFILAAAVALVIAGAQAATAQTPAPAAPAPVDINLDFSKPADQAKMMINGNAAWTNGRLELTTDVSQMASAFLINPVPPTADYLATFQFEIKSVANGQQPADGMMFVSQGVGPDQLGDGGGSLAYASASNIFVPFSYGVEFNSYDGNGLGNGIDETVAWDAFGVRNKFDQSRFPGIGFIDTGVYTAQVRVQPSQITVTVSGGMLNMPPTVAMTSTPLSAGQVPMQVAAGMPLFQALSPKPIFFGFTAGTGGDGTIQDVLNMRIQSPAPAAAPSM